MRSRADVSTSPTLLGRLKDLRDQQAWVEFVRRYTPLIYGFCRGRGLQDADAQDVTQIVLAKLATRMQTFVYDPAKSFRHWLTVVTRNAWADFVAEMRQGQGTGNSEVQEQLAEVEGGDLSKELDEMFLLEICEEAEARVQLRVEPATWQAYWSVVRQGRSVKEVAVETGVEANAVDQKVFRVKKMLKEEIDKLDPPAEV